MKDDSLILIFILNGTPHSVPLWEKLKKDYQYIMLDSVHEFIFGSHKKNGDIHR